MKRLLIFASLLTSVLALTACTAATVEPVTPTAVPSDTPPPPTSTATATRTPIPSPTATFTPTFTPSPTPALPLYDGQTFLFDELLFDNEGYVDCELPCWHGLRIGESTPDDIQAVFDEAFGFNGQIDFFEEPSEEEEDTIGGVFSGVVEDWNMYTAGYSWTIPGNTDYDRQTFSISASVGLDTNTLDVLRFSWSRDSELFQTKLSPQRILQELGAPSEILLSFGLTESADFVHNDLLFVYDEGIVIRSIGSLPTEMTYDGVTGDITKIWVTFCFSGDGLYIDDTSHGGEFKIMEPIGDSLTPYQKFVIDDVIELRSLKSIQEMFDVTPEEVAEMALYQENVCFDRVIYTRE